MISGRALKISVFFPDHKLFEELIANNKVLMFGALGYAAFINFRTVPGVLDLFDRLSAKAKN